MGKKLTLGIVFILTLFVVSSTVMAMDHSMFIKGPFDSGKDVTKKCISCHSEEAEDVQHSIHYQWEGKTSTIKGNKNKSLGKKDDINGFCISTPANEQRCAQCHAGYGYGTEEFSFEDQTNIDCLVCHADLSKYKKAKKDWGRPDKSVDLVKAAQSVGQPTRENCLSCHAYAGGGNNVKEGDIEKELIHTNREYDVHMGTDGADMSCQSCHVTKDHKIPGRSIHVLGSEGTVTCAQCHTDKPHNSSNISKKANATLNEHAQTVACQTCHIPEFSKKSKTKMEWDWSAAGSKDADSKLKGNFVKRKNVKPTYLWYNGMSENYLVGDKINPDGPTILAKPVGSIEDKKSKIYPFKEFTSKQPADAKYNQLITPHLFKGFWGHFDWDKALKAGAEAGGLKYSGEYTFETTKTFIGISHEVVPKEKALNCGSCHLGGDRIDFEALGYEGDPMVKGGRN
ncbi:tetrathionate reductase family octaheme c-type cytochrome [Selenihalanaerobacter shriftii]|uniref:Octaheme c-type cytochrome, tetrathionate reductase family n=1 Tax=Selenihalanaerobacter shriftii TaxID=142842 RepID=A0A1T4M700_9FIRM|nr:tetrathionate reductase family octaheme c-type cytochrome [Selenihalanaerobacter shriftii]SJZ62685.1 octaheme c-type cytochrome, tetrathionate reductase family [Selenihalanaerobacter shriftii]